VGSKDTIVSIQTRLRVRNTGGSNPNGGKVFRLLQNMQNGYGLQPAPYSIFTKVLFGGKWVKA